MFLGWYINMHTCGSFNGSAVLTNNMISNTAPDWQIHFHSIALPLGLWESFATPWVTKQERKRVAEKEMHNLDVGSYTASQR